MMTRIAAGQRAGLQARTAAATPSVTPQGRAADAAPDRPAVAQHDLASLRPDPGSRGKPLPRGLRWMLEHGFGTKLGHVRLHTDAAADRLNRKHRAVAAAQGSSDIYFARGEYDPDSPEGQDIIGHEVAHTLQQRAGRVPMATASQPVNADRRLEAEADSLGAQAARGQRVPFIGAHAIRPVSRFNREAALAPVYASPQSGPAPSLQLVSKKERLRKVHKVTAANALSLRKSIRKVGASSGDLGFYDKRAPTAYGFRTRIGKKRMVQGPHLQSHIAKRAAMAVIEDQGHDPLALLGTPFAPRPNRARKMLKDRLRPMGKVKFDQTLAQRQAHLKHYEKHWNIANDPTESHQTRLNSLRFLGEANASATYNLESGVTTAAQIAGKAESRKRSADEFEQIHDNPALYDEDNTQGFSMFDVDDASELAKRQSERATAPLFNVMSRGWDDADSEDSSDDDDH
jgi:Domain of unknown function (DUF4157)